MVYDNTKNFFGDTSVKQTSKTYTAQVDNIVLDDTVGPSTTEHRTVSGDINEASNSTITGANDTITTTSFEVKNATITGDATIVSGGTFTGGADKFTIANISHGDANIVGDAKTLNNANVTGGHDTITVTGSITGTNDNKVLIAGDAITLTGTNKTFTTGNDNLYLQGSISYAEIYGDAKNISGTGNTLLGGNDTIVLGKAATDSSTSASGISVYLGHGNDSFTAYSSLINSTISGGGGTDTITATTLNGSRIDGGGGADNIKVTNIRGTSNAIQSGSDALLDTITLSAAVKTANGNVVATNVSNSGTTQDTLFLSGGIATGGTILLVSTNGGFTVAKSGSESAGYTGFTMAGGALTGSVAADDVHVGTMSSGNINLAGGDDNAVMDTLANGSIYGGVGNDRISINNLTGGKVFGGSNHDTIVVNNIAGTLDGGTGQDTLKLNSTLNKALNLGDAIAANSILNFEIFSFSELANGGALTGTGGIDNIVVTTMNGGSLSGIQGKDSIDITTLNAGKVYGGAHADTIKIGTLNDGTVSGDGDADNITVTNVRGTTAIIDGGNDALQDTITLGTTVKVADSKNITVTVKNSGTIQDYLALSGGIADGGNVVLSSDSGGFLVAKSMNGQNVVNFDMSGGSLTGSTASDSIFIANMNGGSLNSIQGKDNINITTLNAGKVNGGAHADTINIGTLNDGTVSGDGDVDNITVTNVRGTTAIIDGGNDALQDTITLGTTVKVADSKNITVTVKNSGTIQDKLLLSGGIADGGNVVLSSDSGGFLVAKSMNGQNVVNFDMSGGSLTGSTASDSIFIANMNGGSLNSLEGKDNINITTLNAGKVNGGAHADTINIGTLNGGTVSGDGDIDNITVTNVRGTTAIIDGGNDSLQDFITISSTVKAFNSEDVTVTVKNSGTESDLLFLNQGIAEGGHIVLDSDEGGVSVLNINDGFLATYFDMSGGSLTGSVADDSIYIDNMTGGYINLNGGYDIVYVKSFSDGTISDGDGGARYNITLSGNDGVLKSGEGRDTFHIERSDSLLEYSVTIQDFDIASDRLFIGLAQNITSLVSEYVGGGSFTYEQITFNFTVSSGLDVDNITISERIVTARTFLNNDGEQANIYLDGGYNGGIGSGGIVTLQGEGSSASTFNVTSTDGEGFIIDNGRLVGSANNDNITIYVANNATLDAGAGNDTITVTSVMYSGSTLEGGAGNDTIIVDNYQMDRTGGGISGGAGNDTITVNTFVGGTNTVINGQDGDDTINVKLIAELPGMASLNRVISGGSGADKVNFLAGSSGSILFNDFKHQAGDTIWIDGVNYTSDAVQALEAGQSSFTHNELIIHFGD